MVKEITDKNIWEEFFLKQKEKTFLNSWNWGDFQKTQPSSAKATAGRGEKIWRLGVYDKELINAFLVIKVSARRGTFLFVPHGNTAGLKELLVELKKMAKKEGASFIRFAPICERNEENLKLFKEEYEKDYQVSS